MDTWMDRVIEAKGGTIEEVHQKGFIRWMLQKERTFDTETMQDDCANYQMRLDPELLKRHSRGDMQQDAQTTHTGEARWTNMDNQCYEAISSGCAIVGFFVGYGVAQGKKTSDLCASRLDNAECTIDWQLMPPLCRPDDVDAKNEKIVVSRQEKTEAAGASNEAAGPSNADASDTHDDYDPEGLGADFST